jgi:hypothetical protein
MAMRTILNPARAAALTATLVLSAGSAMAELATIDGEATIASGSRCGRARC